MTGKTILHYKILEKLGEGGMGVVYKAEDTKLKREVALKFLPTNALQSEAEKERFTREAQAAAGLNHANIAHIYAIEEQDDQIFIAMEYIAGESLSEMVTSPLPFDDAINYANQIAAGLQVAHTKGIIHRDIKSANIMITEEGVVKIMDFGLAKISDRSMMTKEGTTLGTAGYMSPEQSRGEKVDHRSDIWSLGVILYEMICGQLPFKGEYESAMIYSIQNEDPEALTALRTGVPLELDGIIAKALAKDPETRYQHVDELPADLRAIETATLSKSRISTTKVDSKIPSRKISWFPWLTASIFLLAFLVISFIHFGEVPEEVFPVRFSIPIPENLSSVSKPIISPDGRKIVFTGSDSSGKTSIWIRSLGNPDALPIPGTDDVYIINFWSPDSRYIIYSNFEWKGKKISVAGGAAETIFDLPKGTWNFWGSWGKEGTILYNYGPLSEGIYQVPAAGGMPTRVTTVDTANGEFGHWWPSFLPNGKDFVYTIDCGGKQDAYIGSLDSDKRELLLKNAGFATYVDPGYLWYIRDQTFMVQSLDPNSHELSSEPVPVLDADINKLSVSESGEMVYHTEGINRQLVWFDRKGNRLEEIGEEGRYFQITLSPDEKKLAVNTGTLKVPRWDAEIWLVDLERTVFSLFASGVDPVWSPDGDRILFTSGFNLMMKNLQGGEAATVLDAPELLFAEDWTRDGRYAVSNIGKSGVQAVWVIPLSGDQTPIPVLQGSSDFDEPQVSPDGQWLVYITNETGQYEIYLQPFLDTGERIRISTNGGGQPRWRKDGKELFYLALDGTLMVVSIESGDNFKAGLPKPLFKVPVTVHPVLDQYVVSGDGQRFLVITEIDTALPPFHVIMNWPEALLKK